MQRGCRLAPTDAGAESSGNKLVVGLTPLKRKVTFLSSSVGHVW